MIEQHKRRASCSLVYNCDTINSATAREVKCFQISDDAALGEMAHILKSSRLKMHNLSMSSDGEQCVLLSEVTGIVYHIY